MFDKFKLVFIWLTLCLLVPLTASAAKPVSGGGSEFYPGDPLVYCGDFRILDDTLEDSSWRVFYDKDGNWVRAAERYSFDDDLYHEDFPDGIHLYGNAQANHQYFYKDGEFWHKVTGLPVGITVPGYGPMYFDAGQFIFVDDELEFIHGNNHNLIWEETDAICDYFRNQ
jgi:hypothetical protein